MTITHSEILPTPPLNCAGVKKCENFARFSTPVAFDAFVTFSDDH